MIGRVPIANAVVASVRRALSDDLAVPRALDELDRLAGSEFVPADIKFLHLDRIFALDLPRYLAGLSPPTCPTCAPRRS